MVTLPYLFIFEFLGPIVEAVGFIVLICLIVSNAINWTTFWLLLITVYMFMMVVNTMCINYDNYVERAYTHRRWYAFLFIPAALEALIYHPLTVFFALKGYWSYISTGEFKWGEMKRKGFKKEATTATQNPAETVANNSATTA